MRSTTIRSLSLLALGGAAALSQAVTLTLDPVTVARPKSGTATYYLSGTVRFDAGEQYAGFQYDPQAYSSEFIVAGTGDPSAHLDISSTGFLSALEQTYQTGVTYSGQFLSFTVSADTPLTTYDIVDQGGFVGLVPPVLSIDLMLPSGSVIRSAEAPISITVGAAPSVPGPAAAASFALMALRRRKRA